MFKPKFGKKILKVTIKYDYVIIHVVVYLCLSDNTWVILAQLSSAKYDDKLWSNPIEALLLREASVGKLNFVKTAMEDFKH